MTEAKENINALFAPVGDGLSPDILDVLESIIRLHSINAQELFYKWESYCLKMGSEETKLDLETVRMFNKDVQDNVERSTQGKYHGRGSDRKSAVHSTPRVVSNGDVFGMLDELTPNTLPRRNASAKRKADFDSPVPRKVSKPETNGKSKTADGPRSIPFSDRLNSGEIVEQLNANLPAAEAPIAPYSEPRLRLVANTDVKKFSYKPMAMRLSESSEILDERIGDFMAIVQKHYGLEDSAFGNAASQSTSEIVAVGRIASDTSEGKLNTASLVLETSRRMGAGLRVGLKIEALTSYKFFPGQIVAVRGINASGHYFTVSEVLSIPHLPMPTSTPQILNDIKERVREAPLNIMFACGPYTADDNLDFEPLKVLCEKATNEMADAMILTGPFLDIEHPLLAAGDFDLPDTKILDQETTMTTLFRRWISAPIQRLCSAVPGITIVLIPSVRDAISKHVSWPQDRVLKKDLGLPKQATIMPNPSFLSLNETIIAVSSQDILYELSQEQISGGKIGSDMMTRLPGYLIDQRHFFPLFPPMSKERLLKGAGGRSTGACLDIGYLKLGEWMNVRPDILVMPSVLTPTVKVVENVLMINPGFLSKPKAAGTFSQVSLQPRALTEEEEDQKGVLHHVFERARVDVVRI